MLKSSVNGSERTLKIVRIFRSIHMAKWNESVIDKDPVLAQEIHAHLQGIGKYVKAMDLVNFMDTPEMRERTGLEKRIDVPTAQRWMKKLDYRWTYTPKGQYVEREDVVVHRQKIFLPRWANIKARTRDWSEWIIVVWFHDESTFYANDRRVARWIKTRRLASCGPCGKPVFGKVRNSQLATWQSPCIFPALNLAR